MPSLIEILNQNTAQPLVQPGQTQPSVLGTQKTVQGIAQAQSGKAPTSGGGPARSALGEQVQNQALQQSIRQTEQAKQGQQLEQTQAAAQQQTEVDLSNAALDEQQLARREDMLNRQQQILNAYTQGSRTLDLNKDKAKLEQLGFNMRLSNDQYVKQLNDEAARNRLNDSVQFEEALKRSLWASEEEMLRDDFDFRAILAADDRQFREALSGMDMDLAINLAMADAKQENLSNIWNGVSGVVSGGVQAYGTYQQNQPSTVAAPNSDSFAAQPSAQTQSPNFAVGGGFTPNGSK